MLNYLQKLYLIYQKCLNNRNNLFIQKNYFIDENIHVISGTFCFKSIQQGPRGFIWDGRWRTVIRRCAQVSERGLNQY